MAFWEKIGSRGRVEDRRGARPATILGGGLGLGGIALILLLNFLGGGDVGDVLSQLLENSQVSNTVSYNAEDFEGEDSYEVFAEAVMGSANDMWREVFNNNGLTYEEPLLVLFRGATESGCGVADSRSGPHYCTLDETIYLDETFFDELKVLLGAEGGDVAEAYVIAHEVGHHVQNKLQDLSEVESQEDSIAIELQADCFAGLWAYSIKDLGVLAPGEIREAMDAAASVGDDRVQEATTGRVNPETWTHGSADERVASFNRGYTTGQVSACEI
jgi:uncharacterized protein